MKNCSVCGCAKDDSCFGKCASNKDGLRSECRSCRSAESKSYYAKKSDSVKTAVRKYRLEHPEKVAESKRNARLNNIEKYKAKDARYRAENKDAIRARRAARRPLIAEKEKARKSARRDEIARVGKLWRERNKEIRAEKTKLWRENNRGYQAEHRKRNIERYRVYLQNRRARKRANGGSLSPGLPERLYRLQRGKCACCGLPLGDDYHIDHIIPIALGGPNTDDNIQLLRQVCNNRKHAKHPVDYMQERGFLL